MIEFIIIMILLLTGCLCELHRLKRMRVAIILKTNNRGGEVL